MINLILIGCIASSPAVARGPKALRESIDELIVKARKHDVEAIRLLGYRRELKAKPALLEVAAEPGPTDDVVKVALARLGERKFTDAYVECLTVKDRAKRDGCISRLGEIGDRHTVTFLIPLLDSESKNEAASALLRILPKEANRIIERRGGKSPRIEDWKKWWQDNRARFPRSDGS